MQLLLVLRLPALLFYLGLACIMKKFRPWESAVGVTTKGKVPQWDNLNVEIGATAGIAHALPCLLTEYELILFSIEQGERDCYSLGKYTV